ncbi:MAG: zf-HC2 domain-containing protein [Deltaproteobacteria bacterium]|nr:zf-HC2 domain-containing protein [Deltaproteobacteria bacterium]
MNNCETIRESIGRWLDGELKATDSESVRLHLAGCADCNVARQQLEKLQLVLKEDLTAQSASIDFLPFWRGVQQRINQKRAWHEDLSEWFREFFTAPRIAWAVPVVIVLVLGLFSLDSYLPGRGGRDNFASVESIDAHGRSVALIREDQSKTTVIWLYQDQEGENETAAEEASKSSPTF